METQSRAATPIRWSSRQRHWSPGSQSKSTFSNDDDGIFAETESWVFPFKTLCKLDCLKLIHWRSTVPANGLYSPWTRTWNYMLQLRLIHHGWDLFALKHSDQLERSLISSEILSETPLGPSHDLLLMMPASFFNDGSQWPLSKDVCALESSGEVACLI